LRNELGLDAALREFGNRVPDAATTLLVRARYGVSVRAGRATQNTRRAVCSVSVVGLGLQALAPWRVRGPFTATAGTPRRERVDSSRKGGDDPPRPTGTGPIPVSWCSGSRRRRSRRIGRDQPEAPNPTRHRRWWRHAIEGSCLTRQQRTSYLGSFTKLFFDKLLSARSQFAQP